jgi:hypothetical protein
LQGQAFYPFWIDWYSHQIKSGARMTPCLLESVEFPCNGYNLDMPAERRRRVIGRQYTGSRRKESGIRFGKCVDKGRIAWYGASSSVHNEKSGAVRSNEQLLESNAKIKE